MALNKKQIDEIKASLKEQADIQARINSSAGDYIVLIKEIKELNKNITSIQKQQEIQKAKFDSATKDFTEAQEKALKTKIALTKAQITVYEDKIESEKISLDIITKELDVIKKTTKELAEAAKQSNKTLAVFKSGITDLKTIGNQVSMLYSKISDTFKMDKSIKSSALQMGVLSKQSDSFANTIQTAANSTIDFGVGIEDLAKMQADYSEELGRTVTLSTKGLEAMGQMAAATGLGAEGSAKLAADFDNIGVSVEGTRDFVEQTLEDSHKMGINASKVIKTIASNMKMLNQYNFKGGIKGLAKMSETVTKLGVSMSFVGGMADKLFSIEGAVDMSAQLQVLGGSWAKLSDPFKLMYMARNDMEGLATAVADAAAASAHFNTESKTFEISALEMDRLRKVSAEAGLNVEEVVASAKKLAGFNKIKTQISFEIKDKDTLSYLETTAQFNKNGEATINIDGKDRLLKSLSTSDSIRLKQMVDEEANLKKRAEDSVTFDETLTNLVNQFKQLLLPIIQTMDKELKPVIKQFTDSLKDPKTFQALIDFAKGIGSFVSGVGKFIVEWPKLTTGLFVVFEASKWFANGMALSAGFNSGSVGLTQGISGLGKNIFKLGGYISLASNVIGIGMDAYKNATDDSLSGWDATIKTLKDNAGKIAGGVIGGFFGGVIGGPAGAAIGAGYGADVGGGIQSDMNDGIIGSPIHDGVATPYSNIGNGLGSDFSKNRGIIQNGKIHPIDNKDSLLAMKPKGPIDNAMKNNSSSSMKIEFGDINFTGDIKLTTSNGQSISVDILKDPSFIREITRKVHSETERVIQGGKNKG